MKQPTEHGIIGIFHPDDARRLQAFYREELGMELAFAGLLEPRAEVSAEEAARLLGGATGAFAGINREPGPDSDRCQPPVHTKHVDPAHPHVTWLLPVEGNGILATGSQRAVAFSGVSAFAGGSQQHGAPWNDQPTPPPSPEESIEVLTREWERSRAEGENSPPHFLDLAHARDPLTDPGE